MFFPAYTIPGKYKGETGSFTACMQGRMELSLFIVVLTRKIALKMVVVGIESIEQVNSERNISYLIYICNHYTTDHEGPDRGKLR